MQRIRRIQLVNCPPIGSLDEAIHDGLTTIVGRNGSGKSALFFAIGNRCWPYGGRFELWTEGSLEEDLQPLMFVDEKLGRFWNVIEKLPERYIPEAFSETFSECMQATLYEGLAANRDDLRFRRIVDLGLDTFRVTIDSSKNIAIEAEVVDRGRAVFFDERTAAIGDRWFVRIAALVSLRRHLELDIPLLADSILGELDESWTKIVCDLLIQSTPQLLLFSTPNEWRRAGKWLHSSGEILLPDPYGGAGLTM